MFVYEATPLKQREALKTQLTVNVFNVLPATSHGSKGLLACIRLLQWTGLG